MTTANQQDSKPKNLAPVGERIIGTFSDQETMRQMRRDREMLAAAVIERARRSLMRFTLFTKDDYKAGWFHWCLTQLLDKFLADVMAGNSPRMIIEAPPRHGKSELASRRFPAYALGRYPDLSFIATSYSSDLASAMNRDVQRIIDSPEYHMLFPGTTLNGSNVRTVADGSYLRNSDIFEVVNRKGIYKSAGVGAGVTGRGGQILLVDDPIKDAAEAHSKTIRDSIWDWFTSTLYTRAEPGGGILIIMTRWHEDDLVGRALAQAEKGGEHWDVVRFPAIAEEDEYDETGELLRKEGEALSPERYDLDSLMRIRKAVGGKVWESLFQQRPSAASGNIFKRENWRYFNAPDKPLGLMSHGEREQLFLRLGISRVIQTWDCAIGAKDKDDCAASCVIAKGREGYYVFEVWQDRMEFPELKREVVSRYHKWMPSKVWVEGAGAKDGKAIVQTIQRDKDLIPVEEFATTLDKVLRAELISPHQEAGLVFLPENAPWVADFVEHCSAFPNAAHDDDVDAFIMGMEHLIEHKDTSMLFTEEFASMMGSL